MGHQKTSTDRQIPCRPESRALAEHFGRETRRKLVDVVQMAMEALYRSEGIELPQQSNSPRRARAGAT
jgi:hypothetical protein